MSDIFSAMKDVSRAASSTTSTLNQVSRTGKAITKVGTVATNAINPSVGTPIKTSQTAMTGTAPIAASVIPNGTCIIIPAAYSLTGQDRFLGKGVYQSLVNLMNGSSDCNNVIIVDAYGNPSPMVYDQTPNGLFLKGTQTPVQFNYEEKNGVKAPAAIALTETEFQAVATGMQKQGKDKFKTSDQGEAEDADNRSWWQRWWQVVVATGIAVVGALATYLIVRKYRKKEKNAQNTSNELSVKVSDLQNQIHELSNTNTGNTNTNDSILAANGVVVNVTESVLNPTPGRER